MIIFSPIDWAQELWAYAWHAEFVEHDKSVYPRSREEFHKFVSGGLAWGATDEEGGFLGLAYVSQDFGAWEISGLAVEIEARKEGVGVLLAYATLGHLLFEEDPLADDPPRPLRVIVHVLESNEQPRTIIEKILRFRMCGPVRIEGGKLPGFETQDDGFIHGHEFEISVPATLEVLANWASTWDGKLHKGKAANIALREGVTLQMWADAFGRMAAEAQPTATDPAEEE